MWAPPSGALAPAGAPFRTGSPKFEVGPMPPDRLDLKALARPFRYRVVLDAEGLPIIPGRLGQIELHDGQTLAVHTNRPRIFARPCAVPGVRRWQVGIRKLGVSSHCRRSRRWPASSRPAGDVPRRPPPASRSVQTPRTRLLR